VHDLQKSENERVQYKQKTEIEFISEQGKKITYYAREFWGGTNFAPLDPRLLVGTTASICLFG